MQEKEYRDLDLLSQSDFKLLDKDPYTFYRQVILGDLKEEGVLSDHFLLGSLVDYTLLTPGLMQKAFHVCSDDKITEVKRNIINEAFNCIKDNLYFKKEQWNLDNKNLEECLLQAANNHKLGGESWKDAQKLGNLLKPECIEYFNSIKNSNGKVLVNFNMFALSQQIVKRLKRDPTIKDKLVAGIDEELISQLVLKGSIKGVPVKGMLDYILINHKTKTIKPKDLKTTRNIKEFIKSYVEYGYYLQGSFYTELLIQNYPGYTIEPFEFIVASSNLNEFPESFTMSELDITAGKIGGTYKYGSVKGFEQIIDDYLWYKENNIWEHKREYYSNKCTNNLRLFSQ